MINNFLNGFQLKKKIVLLMIGIQVISSVEFNMKTQTLSEIEAIPSASMLSCFDDVSKDVFGECFPKLEAEFELMKSKMDTYKTEMEAEKVKASNEFNMEISEVDTELKNFDTEFAKEESNFNLEMGEKFDNEIQKKVVDPFKDYSTPG